MGDKNMQNKRIVVVVSFFLLFFMGTYIFVSQKKIGENNLNKSDANKNDVVFDEKTKTLDYALSLANKGSLEFREKEYGQPAVAIFEKILKDEPNNIQALLGIGYTYEIMEEYGKALDYYNQALELEPKNAVVHNRIGHMYDLSEGMGKAESFYRKALEINPNFIDAKINIARVYLRQNKNEEAMGLLKEVYGGQNMNDRTRAEVGYLLFANAFDNGDYEKAKVYIEEAKESDPTLPMVWVGLGMSKIFEIKNMPNSNGTIALYEESLGYFDKASKIYNYQTAAYYWKGRVVMMTGDNKNAAILFKTAKEVVGKDITLMNEQRVKFEKEIDEYIAEAEKKQSKVISFFKNFFIKTANAAACCSYWSNGVNHNTCQTWCTTQAEENAIYLQLVAGTGAHSATVSGNTVVCINGASATYVPIADPPSDPPPPPPPPPIPGECNASTSAARVYDASSTTWVGNPCSSGTASFPNGTPDFPNYGQTTVSWSCLGTNNGSNKTNCVASRKFPAPTVDLRINGSNGPVNPNLDNGDDLDISWTITPNASGATTYCSKFGETWGSGQIIPSRPLISTDNDLPLPGAPPMPINNRPYSLTCYNGNGNSALNSNSAVDTVLVNIYCNPSQNWSACDKECGGGNEYCTSKNSRCQISSCGSNNCNLDPCPITSEWKEVQP